MFRATAPPSAFSLVVVLSSSASKPWALVPTPSGPSVTCFVAWKIIGALFGGIRVTEQEETEGLDIGEHGMEAYAGFSTTN
jgi:hypothetical protein